MLRIVLSCFSLQIVSLVCAQAPPAGAIDLPTVAEKSEYQATATHEQVMEFCRALAKQSPLVRLDKLGVSHEGRELPLLIVADPPVASPQQAARSSKLVVFAMGNIHAGEVCGKEALLMLARDLATTPKHPLLKDLIVVLAPIYNADGNERFSKENRPLQKGPEGGVGIRENAKGLDLNRDFTKLDAPETKALVKLFATWNPALIVDTHTTNGSHHRYTLTYDGPRHPATHSKLIEFARDEFLPEVGKRLQQETGYKSFFYGNFNDDHTHWESYPAQVRYGTQYVGLRNRLAILSEAYSYAPFKDRVLATRAFVLHCFTLAAEQKAKLNDMLKAAAAAAASAKSVPVRSKLVPRDGMFTVLGFVEEEHDGKRKPTEQTRDYECRLVTVAEPTVSVERPYAYLIPPQHGAILDNLRQHGIEMQVLRETIDLQVESYRIEEVARSEREYQQRHMVKLKATPNKVWRKFEAGSAVVLLQQPLSSLIVNLLEPAGEDSLCTWDFFGESLKAGTDYPVARWLEAAPVLTAPLASLYAEEKPKKPITYEALYSRAPPNFSGSPASGFEWLDDGEHYLQVREGRLRKVEARTGRNAPFHNITALRDGLVKLPTIDRQNAERFARGTSFEMNPDRSGALFAHENDLYFARFDGASAKRLTSTPQREELARFSPDGRFVSFVRDDNLFVVDIETATERALTTAGGGLIRCGKADWVYFEELFDRSWSAYKWSADSSRIAFLQFDDTPVGEFTVVNQVPTRGKVEVERYPKAGDPNPQVKLGIVTAAGGPVRYADLSSYSADNILIGDFGFTPENLAWFYVMDRAQRWLDVNLDGNGVKRLFREKTKAWVDLPGEPKFLKDGSFVLPSQRTGWRHLYHFSKDGALRTTITAGEWETRALLAVDEAGGWIYFTGTKDSHIAENLYRVKLDGSELTRLTREPGSHQITIARHGNLFIDSYSDTQTPTKVMLYAGDGSLVRTLDTNPVPAIAEYQFGQFELLQVPTRDGFMMEGTLVKPPDFDSTKKYPVWFMTYGGPHAPTIRDSWQGGRAFDHLLATMGILVFRCDPRSASGKGIHSTWTAYRQLGVQECQDVEDAIRWLAQRSYVDSKRVGMSGHSYGGFLTAFCLTHSTVFSAGIAGAPVTDWRNYDTIYTERYMDTPQENPEGYERTSVVGAARNLHGKLLILHGGIDDNVHANNTMQLVQALQSANKDFELMLYPQSRHGLFGAHYQRLMVDFIKRSMLE